MTETVCLRGIIRRRSPIDVYQRGTHQLIDFDGHLSAILMSNIYDLNNFNGQLVRICGFNQGLIENFASILVTGVFAPRPCQDCKKKYTKYVKKQKHADKHQHNHKQNCSTIFSMELDKTQSCCDCDEQCPVYDHPIFPPRPQPITRPIEQPFTPPEEPILPHRPIVGNPNGRVPTCDCKVKHCKKCRK